MPIQAPGELTAVDITVLSDGAVAQVVVNERTECFARLHADGAWSPWWPVTNGVTDVSVTADGRQDEASALIAVVVLVPLPVGVHASAHTLHQGKFYRLTASGVSTAAL
jgi:hypothetical protein